MSLPGNNSRFGQLTMKCMDDAPAPVGHQSKNRKQADDELVSTMRADLSHEVIETCRHELTSCSTKDLTAVVIGMIGACWDGAGFLCQLGNYARAAA
jgi:hypothetical protein